MYVLHIMLTSNSRHLCTMITSFWMNLSLHCKTTVTHVYIIYRKYKVNYKCGLVSSMYSTYIIEAKWSWWRVGRQDQQITTNMRSMFSPWLVDNRTIASTMRRNSVGRLWVRIYCAFFNIFILTAYPTLIHHQLLSH